MLKTMRKEKIKQLVDVMQAYINGKTIQYYDVNLSFKIEHPGEPNFNDKWIDVDDDHLFRPDFYDYRIKPEPKYRPFKNAEECWQEMQKHQPFGWVKYNECYFSIVYIGDDHVVLADKDVCSILLSSEHSCKDLTFSDGTPFGIREE